ncbi:MAG TPA: DUF3108 domain-containing protein [Candidatus Cloacimonadota bacterium]|jgi:hypothetical protein|nr:DUF3108 domain-containing protein [Candidatus Cloacimonadales bacterium]HPY97254.1 DUF3108 domain-containing protein [Candidatus Cloacimonadota bacterium]HQB40665.1 DUF3108 domain-containing protein [Candidatus Cloacimonadota bacterium]
MRVAQSLLILLMITTSLFGLTAGEKLTFDIKYGVITAGSATLELKENLYNGRPVWEISSTASTNSFFDTFFKVRDKIESVWDKERHISYKFTKDLKEGNYKQLRIHTYYPEENYTIYSKYVYKKNAFNQERITIPPNTQDIFSAFYYTRLQDLTIGKPLQIKVTTDGKNYTAQVHAIKKEKIKTIFGEINCIKIKPDLVGEAIFKQSGDIFIWITDDKEKIPVLLESKVVFGSFKAVLVKAENVSLKK